MARVKFTTTIDEEVLQWIKIRAIKEKRSVSNLIEEMIKQKQELEGKSFDDHPA